MPLNHKITNDESTYGWGPVIMHWLIALAIIGLYPLGLYIETLTYYDPEYRTVPVWHKGIGLIISAVFVLRLLWRFANKPPKELPQPAMLALLSKLIHGLLYLLLAVVLISGYLISTADGRGIELFGWFTVPALPYSFENQEDIAGEVHFITATVLISFAALHAAAALKHHFIDKDSTLKRMLALREEH